MLLRKAKVSVPSFDWVPKRNYDCLKSSPYLRPSAGNWNFKMPQNRLSDHDMSSWSALPGERPDYRLGAAAWPQCQACTIRISNFWDIWALERALQNKTTSCSLDVILKMPVRRAEIFATWPQVRETGRVKTIELKQSNEHEQISSIVILCRRISKEVRCRRPWRRIGIITLFNVRIGC